MSTPPLLILLLAVALAALLLAITLLVRSRRAAARAASRSAPQPARHPEAEPGAGSPLPDSSAREGGPTQPPGAGGTAGRRPPPGGRHPRTAAAREGGPGPQLPAAAPVLRSVDEEERGRGGGALSLEERLRRAVRRGEVALVYEPIVAVATGRCVGFEAQVRWERAERELPPERVLPLAEATGLAVELDAWILDRALADLGAWRRGTAGEPGAAELAVAVNLTAASLDDPGLAPRVARALTVAGLPEGALELEVAEAVAMRDALRASRAMDAVRSHGARVVLDDFGTAYSALLYLRTFPLDLLKIDRTFARALVDQPVDQEIAASLVRLVHALGMQVEAAGVDGPEQLAALARHGCDRVQGRHVGPLLAAGECVAFLRRGGARPVRADS